MFEQLVLVDHPNIVKLHKYWLDVKDSKARVRRTWRGGVWGCQAGGMPVGSHPLDSLSFSGTLWPEACSQPYAEPPSGCVLVLPMGCTQCWLCREAGKLTPLSSFRSSSSQNMCPQGA